MITPVRLNGRELKPHKATIAPILNARTVLTNSPWEFVSLWLTRQKRPDALFYWNQAREFAHASIGMPVQSAPLLHYYSFMNCAKALLAAKDVRFNEYHGIQDAKIHSESKPIDLANEGVRIKKNGVLPSLASYLGDTEKRTMHTLQELLFNLPFVHRTYCLTYQDQPDLFFTLKNCEYRYDTETKKAYLGAELSEEFCDPQQIKKLLPAFLEDSATDNPRAIRSKAEETISNETHPSATDIERLTRLNKILRQDLHLISGAHTLWYAKAIVAGPKILQRSSLTLTLAVMHRLSEICRYRPLRLKDLMAGEQNWLISEFVMMSPDQFLDGIATEITGHQFMAPNVRPAN